MWQRIANLILRNRLFMLGALTLLTVFFGYFAASNIKLENKYGVMLPKDSEATQQYRLFKERFGEDGGTLVVAIQTDSLYTETNFLKWKEMGDSILQIDGVDGVISEATLFTIKNNQAENKFDVKRIFSDISYQEKSIDSIQKEIKSNPIYKNLLYNDKSKVSLMLIKVDEKYLSDKHKSKVVFDIEDVAKHFEPYFGKMHYSGLPHLRVIIGKRVQSEMYIFVGLSLLVTSLLLYFFFRSIRVTFVCVFVVAITVVWSIGTIGLFNFKLSILMALIPPLMIVIGIPNSIFLMTKYHQEIKEHGNKMKALSYTITRIGTAIFLTNVTTAVGFATFLFTNSEKMIEFGWIASINIMFAFVVSLVLLPIISSFSKPPIERHLKHLDRKFATNIIDWVVNVSFRHRKWVYGVTIFITVITSIGIFKMHVTGNLTSDLPTNDQVKTDLEFIQNNFGGAIPFEVMVNYKEDGRLKGPKALNLLSKVDEAQTLIDNDTLFSQSISVVNFMKVVNMAYYGNDTSFYRLPNKMALRNLGKYIQNFNMTNANGGGLSIKELLDTTHTTLRIRCQMRDVGSYDVSDKSDYLKVKMDSIFNPDKKDMERMYLKIKKEHKLEYVDSILETYPELYNGMADLLAQNRPHLQVVFAEKGFDLDFLKSFYKKKLIHEDLRKVMDQQYYDLTFTGTSVVASEGTKYLVNNLMQSIFFAVISIAALMSILFYSFRIVLVSMIPNLIPMFVTAGIMGWFGIPLKPSTLLIFSIALGITVDNTIHFLAHYRHELKTRKWDIKECIAISIHEAGFSIIYTSFILFFGFIVFVFSKFGGTQALGYLSAITYFVALFTNLILLPSLLLSYERKVTTKSFEEPMFEIYDEESDIDWNLLEINKDQIKKDLPKDEA